MVAFDSVAVVSLPVVANVVAELMGFEAVPDTAESIEDPEKKAVEETFGLVAGAVLVATIAVVDMCASPVHLNRARADLGTDFVDMMPETVHVD